MFSFNNPYGACPECSGLGFKEKIDPDLVISDPSKSLRDGAISAMGWGSGTAAGDGSIRMMYFNRFIIPSSEQIPPVYWLRMSGCR